MVKIGLLILLTVATVVCALGQLAMLGATDQGWLPMEQTFLAATGGALVLTMLLLWARIRQALVLVVATDLLFGCYYAWKIYGTVRSENYSSPTSLVLLILMGLCPFVTALVVVAWGNEFCRRMTQAG